MVAPQLGQVLEHRQPLELHMALVVGLQLDEHDGDERCEHDQSGYGYDCWYGCEYQFRKDGESQSEQ